MHFRLFLFTSVPVFHRPEKLVTKILIFIISTKPGSKIPVFILDWLEFQKNVFDIVFEKKIFFYELGKWLLQHFS